jgi:hypothetical protein
MFIMKKNKYGLAILHPIKYKLPILEFAINYTDVDYFICSDWWLISVISNTNNFLL